MAYASTAGGPLFSEGGASPLRLLAYLAVAIVLMVIDYRGGYLDQSRRWLSLLNEPLYRVASLPSQAATALHDNLSWRSTLSKERDTLANQLLVARAQLARMESLQRENQRLRSLMQGARGLRLQVQLAALADFDLDPFRHRIVLDRGSRDGVREGLAIIDADGLVGQVIDVTPLRSTAMLISDPSHAVPVLVQRSGLRTIAFGTGDLHSLQIPNIPQSADVRVGDLLLTSGIGGGFPAGLHVARITRLLPDDTRLFVVADAVPVAALDRSGDVLLVWDMDTGAGEQMGPPELPASGNMAPGSGDKTPANPTTSEASTSP